MLFCLLNVSLFACLFLFCCCCMSVDILLFPCAMNHFFCFRCCLVLGYCFVAVLFVCWFVLSVSVCCCSDCFTRCVSFWYCGLLFVLCVFDAVLFTQCIVVCLLLLFLFFCCCMLVDLLLFSCAVNPFFCVLCCLALGCCVSCCGVCLLACFVCFFFVLRFVFYVCF